MSLPTNRPPFHPGKILLEEFIKPLGISQNAFSQHVGWTYARLNEIVNGKRGITPETALILADALGTTPDVWLNLQKNYDLWIAQKKHHPVRRIALLGAGIPSETKASTKTRKVR